MRPEEIYNPTPAQMTAALLEAAQAGRWNHWQHEVETHAGDWVTVGATRKPLTAEQFARLPAAVVEYQFVELCLYRYKGKVVWGYYCKKLPFEGNVLIRVSVSLEPTEGEIIHCMLPGRGKRYVERWGEQEKLFVPVRG
ncbi:MAG TPA: hypothetical protein EYP49_16020 [Anaerolineae bacterium]|nr:hypothetical protein [Anaerolineae bacterium]